MPALTVLFHRLAELLLGPVARAAMITADQDGMFVTNPRVIVRR